MRHVFGVIVSAAIAASAALIGTGTAAYAAAPATVSIVQGLPRTSVDVFVDGRSTLHDLRPGTVAGPLRVRAGLHTVTVFPASNTTGSGTPLITSTTEVAGGRNYTLVANLTTLGKPTITPYFNDTSPVAAGRARLVVRHVAAAPILDVRADGTIVFARLMYMNEMKADLPAGSVTADVLVAATSTVAVGPATLDLTARASTVVYVIGSAADRTLALVVQTIPDRRSAVEGAPAAAGVPVDHEPGAPGWVLPVCVVGTLLALIVLVVLFRDTRPSADLPSEGVQASATAGRRTG